MTKSSFKKISYDVIVITTPKTVTKLTSQNFSILGLFHSKFLSTPMPFCHTLWF